MEERAVSAEYSQDIPRMTRETETIVDEFFASSPVRHYKKGHIVVVAGEPAEHVYYLVSGRVKVYDVTYRGDEIVVVSMRGPSLFPLSSVMNKTAPRYMFEADSDIALKQAPIDEMSVFLNDHPEVVSDLFSSLYRQMEGMLKKMVYSITSSAKMRLVYTLVMECHLFGVQQPDGSWRLEETEKDLAAKAGLSRETVSRESRSLKKPHLLEIHHSYISIPDLQQLEHYLDAHS